MSEYLRKAVEDLEAKLQDQLNEVAETKNAINVLCRQLGDPPRFNDVSPEKIASLTSTRSDQFFNKPLTTAVREYLAMRGSAATVNEIYDALCRGGFEFVGKNESIKKRGLQISLAKNRRLFAYVKSSDSFGLWSFYGGRPKDKDDKEEEGANTIISNEEDTQEEETETKEAK